MKAQLLPADQDAPAQVTQWINLSNRVLLDWILNSYAILKSSI